MAAPGVVCVPSFGDSMVGTEPKLGRGGKNIGVTPHPASPQPPHGSHPDHIVHAASPLPPTPTLGEDFGRVYRVHPPPNYFNF